MDRIFPFGENHQNFAELATELAAIEPGQILTSFVEVKNFDTKSTQFAQRYQKDEKNLPEVFLFENKSPGNIDAFSLLKPIRFESEKDSSGKIQLDPIQLRLFIRKHTPFQILLPNCTKELDQLADMFVQSLRNNDRHKIDNILEQVESLTNKSSKSKRKTVSNYLLLMKKGAENGELFYKSEQNRIRKLLKDSNVAHAQQRKLKAYYNVLQSFRFKPNRHTEL